MASGHDSEQTPEDSEGQGSLVGCSLWGCKESDMTELPNSNYRDTAESRTQHSLGTCTPEAGGGAERQYVK